MSFHSHVPADMDTIYVNDKRHLMDLIISHHVTSELFGPCNELAVNFERYHGGHLPETAKEGSLLNGMPRMSTGARCDCGSFPLDRQPLAEKLGCVANRGDKSGK